MKVLIYMLARLLKAPLFWVPISPYKRWKFKQSYFKHDLYFVSFCTFCFTVTYILGLWIGISISVFILTLFFLTKISE